jgi:hypothetical protein
MEIIFFVIHNASHVRFRYRYQPHKSTKKQIKYEISNVGGHKMQSVIFPPVKIGGRDAKNCLSAVTVLLYNHT